MTSGVSRSAMKASRLERWLEDESALAGLAHELAPTLPSPCVLTLEGELGAGKSAFARALLRALGVTGTIRSPTYTLVETYESAVGPVAHLDLYRIGTPDELEYLDFGEILERHVLVLIEWPAKAGGFAPSPDLRVELAYAVDPGGASDVDGRPGGSCREGRRIVVERFH